MKFLCVPCDEQMKLKHALGPDGGSVALVYSCPACSAEMAMMTNPHETQVVGSLGVRIGPESGDDAAAASSKCPFTGMLAEMGMSTAANAVGAASVSTASPAATVAAAPPIDGGAGGMARDGVSGGIRGGVAGTVPSGIRWTDEARERLANIPDIVRTSAVAGIEKFALDHGYDEVDAAVLERARSFFGIA